MREMQQDAFAQESGGFVLRRRSWPWVTWGGAGLLAAITLAAWQAIMGKGNVQDAWALLASMSGAAAVVLRVGSCRLVLFSDGMRVDNLIGSHYVPYASITSVGRAEGSGGLCVETSDGREIHCFAFGGSVVDAVFKTTPKAVALVQEYVQRATHSGAGDGVRTVRFRLCWTSEGLFAISVVAAGVAILL
ncbi:hypothetical protein [Streptomyces sp. WZ.A104]|uniref:hypothetical protein n=1 Tax=Streptomyces sp. WZ.A104 TaxID=2023771 RepID=UPI00117DA76C|nr:hypothetical protein [Streptomyces sp. WZ.A104]